MTGLVTACQPGGEGGERGAVEKSYAFGGPAQGTSYMVKYHGAALRDYQESIDSILLVIDHSLSTYIDHSTISQFNRQREFVTNDPHFVRMLFDAKDIRDKSGGAFEPAVLPLLRAWGFGPEGAEIRDSVQIDSLLALVNWDFEVKVSNQTASGANRSTTLEIIKNRPVEFDFNGIAQGYTVDVIFGFLAARGIENLLVEIGGEVRAKGVNDREQLWRIGIDKPDADAERGAQATVELDDRAVATSGNYRKYYEKDGKRYSHTIDPTTGYPVDHQLLSATVMASSCAVADAFATVFMVLGPERAKAFLASDRAEGLDALLVYYDDAGQLQTHATPGMRNRMLNESRE